MSQAPDIIYRSQKKRYPWWVRSTDAPTVPIDPARTRPPAITRTAALFARHLYREDYEQFIAEFPDVGLKYHVGEKRMVDNWRRRWEVVRDNIRQRRPGSSQRDLALAQAANSLYYHTYIDFKELTD